MQVTSAVVLLTGLAVGGFYGQRFLKQRTRDHAVAAGWHDFELAGRQADLDAMRAALDRVLTADPNEPTAIRRRAAINAGTADPDDAELATVLLRHHVRHDRPAEAAREAAKVLARYPRHWLAHCARAHQAFRAGDRDRAVGFVRQFPDPEHPDSHLDLGGLLYGFTLYTALGLDPAPLRGLIMRRLLPMLRGEAAGEEQPAGKAQLIACYLIPFTDSDPPLRELAGYWAVVARLADTAVTEAAATGDADTLTRLAHLDDPLTAPGLGLLQALTRMRAGGLVTDDQFRANVREIAGRSRRAWQAAREKDPTRVEPYLGLAREAIRDGDREAALKVLVEGMTACGARPALLDPFIRIQVESGNAETALKNAHAAARATKVSPHLWCVAAFAATAAGRRDIALAACDEARELAPTDPLACRLAARLWLDAGQPARALELLRPLGEVALRTDATLARLHARVLVEAGLDPLWDVEFEGVVGTPSPQPAAFRAAAFLRGMLDARPPADQMLAVAAWVATHAEAAHTRWPEPALRRVLADALYRRAELGTPNWDAGAVWASLRAYGGLPADTRSDPAAIAAMASLQLNGMKDPATALQVVASLRAVETDPARTLEQLEILAAVYNANGRSDDALRLLVPVLNGARGTVGCWVQLALAYHAKRQPVEAAAALLAAESVPGRTTREHADWLAARAKLQKENP